KNMRQQFAESVKDIDGVELTGSGCRNQCNKSPNLDIIISSGDKVTFNNVGNDPKGLPVGEIVKLIKQISNPQ
ncbi:MAG TPA: hypothetical protein VHE53_05705, partial [Patescibacteria group bacterium]|nr:hypothetical protein [Patescibacteria group bacterium]